MSVQNVLSHSRRSPSTMNGISKRLLMIRILQLVSLVENGATNGYAVQQLSGLLQSLDRPRIPGLSIFPELYVMSVFEREGLYRSMPDPHLFVELLGPHVGDTIFYAMNLILENSYGLKVGFPEADEAYKWYILRDKEKIGDLAYDRKNGCKIPRLRATLKGRTITICYEPVGLVVDAWIHFNPSSMRRQLMIEALPTFREREEEFIWMLKTRPSEFIEHVERHVSNNRLEC
jgi:hypothetical protein